MNRNTPRSFLIGLALAVVAVGNSQVWAATSLTSPLPISEIPLIVPVSGHPQVLFAISNSQSMDGTLSGAIFTGTGAVSGGLSSLTASSSPTNYLVPAGFTAPVTGTASPGNTVYTCTTANCPSDGVPSGTEVDNSASRLNEAKEGIQAIIAAYAANTSFALEDYNASTGGSTYATWLYLMSGSPGFTFSATNTSPPTGYEAVPNPCYNYLLSTTSATVQSNCASIVSAGLYSNLISNNKYMIVAQSSDDADVNDVLYAGAGLAAIFDTYGGPSPLNPYTGFSLAQYNNGSIFVQYNASAPNEGAFGTSPTNAGFVPFSPQVMYEQRGFGFDGNASATTGTIVVGNPTIISAGTTPTPTTIAAVNAAFAPALAPETNNANSAEIKAVAVQAPIAGMMASALTYFKSSAVTTTTTPGCTVQQSVILVTDGLPTQDLSNRSWPPLGSAAAAGYGVTATFNANGTVASTNDQALTDAISKIAALKAAGINVYVIGMGAGVNAAANPTAQQTLTAMAVAGGTGAFFPAASVTALVADLNSILGSIENATETNGSLPVLGPRLTSASLSYQTSFKVNGSDWTGDLQAFAINTTTGVLSTTPTWDAATLLNARSPGSRNLFTDLTAGTAAGSNTSAVSFVAADLGSPATTASELAFLGFPPLVASQYTGAAGALALPPDMVSYLSGDQTNDQGTTGTYRTRSSVLGDIVDSIPAVSSAVDDYGYGNLGAADGGTTYETFVASKKTRTPQTMVYVGANDGMLHGFDGALGTEEFGFIPNSVASNLGLLLNPFYVHQFYVDGPLTLGDAYLSSNWQTVLLGTPGAGGSGLFALNVTNPSGMGPGSVMWELTASASPYMGYDLGQAQIILGEDDKWYAVVGNGYNSTNSAPAVFIISLATGQIAATLVATDPDTTPTPGNGIGQVAAADLTDQFGTGSSDGKVDTIYAGDYDGNVWKFDIHSNGGPAIWASSSNNGGVANGGKPLFTAIDSAGNHQPITGNFELAPGPLGGVMVYFGTGSYFLVGDNLVPATPKVQTLYGVWDDPNLTSTTLTRANLAVQTVSASTVVTNPPTRVTSSNSVSYTAATTTGAPAQFGFYMDLKLVGGSALGEEFFGTPVVQNGIIFYTTFTPQAGAGCSDGGTNFLYGLSSLSGANALTPLLGTGGSTICASGSCGAVQIGPTGSAPVPAPSIVVPPSPVATGLAGSTTSTPPVPCNWSGTNSSCTNPTSLPTSPAIQCDLTLNAPGFTAQIPRPCHRQSWRQIR
jgi:type IV pilus assembly protein PilY1